MSGGVRETTQQDNEPEKLKKKFQKPLDKPHKMW